MNTLKVALITLEGGGISTVCYGLAHSLSRKRIFVTVFTEAYGKSEVIKVNHYLTIYRLRSLSMPPRFFWFQVNNYRFISKVLKDYTLIHGVYPDASVIFSFCKKNMAKPFIASFHAVPTVTLKWYANVPLSSWTAPEFAHHILEYPLHDFNIKTCIARADHIIACSYTTLNELKTAYKSLDDEKITVIHNSVDFNEIEKIKPAEYDKNKENASSLIFAGRLYWLKGPMYLLEAFRNLKKEFKSLHLKIFGTGPEEDKMKKLVVKTGLKDCVHFYGRVPHGSLIAQIKKSDVVVVPSVYEAQPMIALEAMACKKPLVAFAIPSMQEIIVNWHNGLLAKPYSAKDLAEKIRLVLQDKKLRSNIGHNAYNYVKREHNWEIQVEKYIDIYKAVI